MIRLKKLLGLAAFTGIGCGFTLWTNLNREFIVIVFWRFKSSCIQTSKYTTWINNSTNREKNNSINYTQIYAMNYHKVQNES